MTPPPFNPEEFHSALFNIRLLLDRLTAQLEGLGIPSQCDEMVWITKAIAHRFNLEPGELTHSRCRTANVAWARQIAMFLARKITKLTLTEIGKAFGRDHGTVMHACKHVQDVLDTDPKFRALYQSLEADLAPIIAKAEVASLVRSVEDLKPEEEK